MVNINDDIYILKSCCMVKVGDNQIAIKFGIPYTSVEIKRASQKSEYDVYDIIFMVICQEAQ